MTCAPIAVTCAPFQRIFDAARRIMALAQSSYLPLAGVLHFRDLTPCALLLFPARSAGREHRFSVGNFRCFSRRLLGQPSRLGFFPGLTLSFASCRLGSLPGGQLGRLLFPGRASGRFAFRYPAIAGGPDLVTSLEPLGAFELSLFGGVCHAQAYGKIGCSHRKL